jgi:hypothetical protein
MILNSGSSTAMSFGAVRWAVFILGCYSLSERCATARPAFALVVDPRGQYSNSLENLQALLRDHEPLGG